MTFPSFFVCYYNAAHVYRFNNTDQWLESYIFNVYFELKTYTGSFKFNIFFQLQIKYVLRRIKVAEEILFVFCSDVWPGARTLDFRLINQHSTFISISNMYEFSVYNCAMKW